MTTIYELDASNVYTGLTRKIDEGGACPTGWTRVAPLDTTLGQFALLMGSVPVVLDTYPTTYPTREDLKQERQQAIDSIDVTVGDKSFDGDELSQNRMARAILGLQAAGLHSITWTLADNTITEVTLAELTEALVKAGQRQAELWPITEVCVG